jgi:HAD superfamily hydrolase (TIGR01509 family)
MLFFTNLRTIHICAKMGRSDNLKEISSEFREILDVDGADLEILGTLHRISRNKNLNKSRTMSFYAAVFDLDGVVADTESVQLEAINIVLKPFGVQVSEHEWATKFVGIPVEEDIATIHAQNQLPVPLDRLAAARRETYARLIQAPDGLQPNPGLVALLEYLEASGMTRAIASGSPRVDVMNVLQQLGIVQHFKAIVTSDDVTRPKPSPDVYLRAASESGVPPSSCIAVEDSASGMVAAKAAGMTVIGFPSKFTQYQNLKPDLFISSLEQVQSFLAKTRSQ